jgi:hypothetical protein
VETRQLDARDVSEKEVIGLRLTNKSIEEKSIKKDSEIEHVPINRK